MSDAPPITIELAPVATDDVRALVGELERELSAEYPPEQRHGLALDAIFRPHIRFFVARMDGAAVGCGGVALFEGFAEVKRMYVRDGVRGRGVAQALLARIELVARAAGMAVLRLETGERQVAALRLYAKRGFGGAWRSAPMRRWYRRPSRPVFSWKKDSRRRLGDNSRLRQ